MQFNENSKCYCADFYQTRLQVYDDSTERHVKNTTILNDACKKPFHVIHSIYAESRLPGAIKAARTRAHMSQHKKRAIFLSGIITRPNEGSGPECDHRLDKPRYWLHAFNFNLRFKVLNKILELERFKNNISLKIFPN